MTQHVSKLHVCSVCESNVHRLFCSSCIASYCMCSVRQTEEKFSDTYYRSSLDFMDTDFDDGWNSSCACANVMNLVRLVALPGAPLEDLLCYASPAWDVLHHEDRSMDFLVFLLRHLSFSERLVVVNALPLSLRVYVCTHGRELFLEMNRVVTSRTEAATTALYDTLEMIDTIDASVRMDASVWMTLIEYFYRAWSLTIDGDADECSNDDDDNAYTNNDAFDTQSFHSAIYIATCIFTRIYPQTVRNVGIARLLVAIYGSRAHARSNQAETDDIAIGVDVCDQFEHTLTDAITYDSCRAVKILCGGPPRIAQEQ